MTLPLSVQPLAQAQKKPYKCIGIELLAPDGEFCGLKARSSQAGKQKALFLLQMVSCLDPLVQVILDDGAQILEREVGDGPAIADVPMLYCRLVFANLDVT